MTSNASEWGSISESRVSFDLLVQSIKQIFCHSDGAEIYSEYFWESLPQCPRQKFSFHTKQIHFVELDDRSLYASVYHLNTSLAYGRRWQRVTKTQSGFQTKLQRSASAVYGAQSLRSGNPIPVNESNLSNGPPLFEDYSSRYDQKNEICFSKLDQFPRKRNFNRLVNILSHLLIAIPSNSRSYTTGELLHYV